MGDGLSIEVGSTRLDTWLSYSLDSELLTPSDSFAMEVALRGPLDDRRAILDLLSEGQQIRAYVIVNRGTSRERRVLQHTGILEVRETMGSRDRVSITCHCRDLASHLVDSNVPIRENVERSFVDLVREYVSPWDIEVELDPVAARHIVTGQATTTRAGRLERQRARAAGIPARQFNRRLAERAERARVPIDELAGGSQSVLERAERRAQRDMANSLTRGDIERIKLAEARPQPGETVWGFLSRHAARFGLMMWFSPEGKLIIASPDYGSPPLHRIVRRITEDPADRNNVIEGGSIRNAADRYSAVQVYGRGGGRNAARSRVKHLALDPELPYTRLLVVHDQSVKTGEEAERRALRELAKHQMKAHTLRYTLAGHSDGEHVYAPDTIVDVYDELAVVAGRWYVLGRRFTSDRKKGPMTEIELIPPGSLVL